MDMKSGITDKLAAAGYTNVDYQCAGGDTTALQTIVTSMTDGSYDLVITIATPPTQAVVNVESDTPNVFCAVSAPVAAGVMSDLETPDKNSTGVSNAIPVSEILSLAQATTPVEKFGLIYSGNELPPGRSRCLPWRTDLPAHFRYTRTEHNLSDRSCCHPFCLCRKDEPPGNL